MKRGSGPPNVPSDSSIRPPSVVQIRAFQASEKTVERLKSTDLKSPTTVARHATRAAVGNIAVAGESTGGSAGARNCCPSRISGVTETVLAENS